MGRVPTSRTTARTELRIEDPRALRALAHPARQRIISELYAGETLTATEAAKLVGLTPSATSYHLRALEKWGVAVRDAPGDDGRERPWRSAADSITVLPTAHRRAGLDASRTSVHAWLGDLEDGLERLRASVTQGREQGMTSRGRLWLTPDEERQLRECLWEAVADLRGRTRRDHPAGATPYDVFAFILPADES